MMKMKWPYMIASAVGLTGAFFGGILGSLAAAFAGDSWWSNQFAFSSFQCALFVGGVCFGAVPGMIWLLCLRQKWVLPFLSAGVCAMLLPVIDAMYMANHITGDSRGLTYAGVVAFGFVGGTALWMIGRRPAKQ